MSLPNAVATLTPDVAATDYVYFQRDLTDPAGLRRGPDRATGVFTRDYAGAEFEPGKLYCFCASSPTAGDCATLGFFKPDGVPVVYTGQPINDPGNLTPDEQQLIAPVVDRRPVWERLGRAIQLDPDLRTFSDDFNPFQFK